MFPNATMMRQETWNDILRAMLAVRDAHGWREEAGPVAKATSPAIAIKRTKAAKPVPKKARKVVAKKVAKKATRKAVRKPIAKRGLRQSADQSQIAQSESRPEGSFEGKETCAQETGQAEAIATSKERLTTTVWSKSARNG